MPSPDTEPKKWLIFQLEIVERELDGKLLICQEALKRGGGCISGTKAAVRESLEHLPPGVMFLKSIIVSELGYMQMFKEAGHKLVCLDEEGLIQNSLEHMVTVRATEETLNEVDAFMLWGKVQQNAYMNKYPQHKDKFYLAGNPRADLWGKEKYHQVFEEEVTKLKERFGDYFILPTSFGSYNHFMGKDGAMSIYKVDKMISDEDYIFLKGYRDYVKNIYYGFMELMDPLSKAFPDTNIIVRPHPSENRKPWDKLAKNYDNVTVEFEGSVTPWLLASKAILHCGSTTAVEGHLMDRPVIAYCRGKRDFDYELEVPAQASINVTEQDKVIALLQQIQNGTDINKKYPEAAEGHEWLKGWIVNMGDQESSEKIMDILEDFDVSPLDYTPKTIKENKQISPKEIVWSILSILEHVPPILNIMPFRIKQGIRSRRYGKSKTKDINISYLCDYLKRLQQINNNPESQVIALRKNLIVLR